MKPLSLTAQPLPLPFPLVPPLIKNTPCMSEAGKRVYSVGLIKRHCPAVADVIDDDPDTKMAKNSASRAIVNLEFLLGKLGSTPLGHGS